jgi:hypothetical protein
MSDKLIMALAVGAIAVAAVMAATEQSGEAATSAIHAATSPAATAHRCTSGKHAVIVGKHKCLKTGQQCKRRDDVQYHRYGFHCHGGRLTRRVAPAKKPKAVLDATTLVFGDQVTGRTSAPKTVKLTNKGAASLEIGIVAVTGANASDFGTTGCAGTSMAAGASCSISVTFTPEVVGARAASLRISNNAPGGPHAVALAGTGVAPPSISGEGSSNSPPFRDCHHMNTRATLQPGLNPPLVIATTRIWSECFFGGFTGTAGVIVADANGGTLDAIDAGVSWGVNGVFESTFDTPNDRTVSWEAPVRHPDRLGLAASIIVVHTWAPRNRLVDIFNKAVAAGQKVAEVLAVIATLVP